MAGAGRGGGARPPKSKRDREAPIAFRVGAGAREGRKIAWAWRGPRPWPAPARGAGTLFAGSGSVPNQTVLGQFLFRSEATRQSSDRRAAVAPGLLPPGLDPGVASQ